MRDRRPRRGVAARHDHAGDDSEPLRAGALGSDVVLRDARGGQGVRLRCAQLRWLDRLAAGLAAAREPLATTKQALEGLTLLVREEAFAGLAAEVACFGHP